MASARLLDLSPLILMSFISGVVFYSFSPTLSHCIWHGSFQMFAARGTFFQAKAWRKGWVVRLCDYSILELLLPSTRAAGEPETRAWASMPHCPLLAAVQAPVPQGASADFPPAGVEKHQEAKGRTGVLALIYK